MDDEVILSKVKKTINQGNTGQLREQIQQNLNKLRKVYSEQLNAAQYSIQEMEKAIDELNEVKESLATVEEATKNVTVLATKLKPIRDESSRHSQLSTAKENFKHIFDVPQNVSTTRQYITEGKLLLAHQHLRELESSRYALLYELHRTPSSNPNDKITLKQYFSDVDKLSDELGRQIWLIVRRTLTCVRRDPQTIVSALRIIEHEERADEQAIKRYESTNFMPPGRPKQWRKRVFDILEEAVAERISANQFEERTDKHWLVKHLEVIRLMMLEDLRVVNVACVQCFPSHYNIANEMLKLYHKCLRSHLLDLSHHLDGNEYVHLLNWVQAYSGKDLLGHPQLNIDINQAGLDPLLPEANKLELTDKYFATIEKNFREWMKNTINREEQDWSSSEKPEEDDNDGHFHTTTPVFIFQMIDQHLKVAETVNQSLEDRILALSMDQLTIFAQQYKESIDKYCRIEFSNRGRYQKFTAYMVAITNNCSIIEQLFLDMEKSRPTAVNSFKALRDESLDKLLEELFLDVGKEINQIGSQDWMYGKISCVENICYTLKDYFEDYKHLKSENHKILKRKLAFRMARDYTKAILMKKINPGSQRELFSKKFFEDGQKLEREIDPTGQIGYENSPFRPLKAMKEFLLLKDPDLLALEVQNLKRCYPDMNESHLAALLSMTDIIPRRDCLKEAKRMLEAVAPNGDQESKTIFSEIQLPS